jgi:D-psicose/D-tagatose/L-ribulose 3-epimerase
MRARPPGEIRLRDITESATVSANGQREPRLGQTRIIRVNSRVAAALLENGEFFPRPSNASSQISSAPRAAAANPSPEIVRLGLNTFLFTSPFTTRSTPLFASFARWGFDMVEIAIEDPRHVDPVKVRAAAQRAGIAIGAVCACTPPGRDLRGTPAEQRAMLDYTRTLIDQAVVLGASTIIGPFYSVVGRADAVAPRDRRRQWSTVVKHLRELARYAEPRGVTLCIEPLNRFETDFLNTTEQGLALLDDIGSPAAKLLLDTFHMNIEEKSLPAALRRAGKNLGHLHACGSDRGTPGGDHTDWRGIAAALKAIDYRGDVVIESFTPNVKVIARAAAIWRQIEPSPETIARDGMAFLRKTFA